MYKLTHIEMHLSPSINFWVKKLLVSALAHANALVFLEKLKIATIDAVVGAVCVKDLI